MLAGDQRSLAAYEEVSKALDKDVVVVVSMAGEQLFTAEGLQQLRGVCDALTKMTGLRDVKSLTHSVKPVKQGFSFGFQPFIPPGHLPAEEVSKIREYATTHPLVKNIMAAEDAKHALIICQFNRDLSTPEQQREFRTALDELLRPFVASGFDFHTIALPLVALEVRTDLIENISQVATWLGVVMTMLLLAAFRSLGLTLLCCFQLAFVAALLPGMMKSIGAPLTFYSLMLFPLVAGIQLTLMTHLFMGCVRAGKEGLGPAAAINRTLRRVFKSCGFATLTTVVGMLSLTICEIRQVSDFGIIGATGIGLAFLWTFGPGISALLLFQGVSTPKANPQVGAQSGSSKVSAWINLIVRGHWAIISVATAGLLVAGVGVTQIRTDIRVTEFLDRTSPTRIALQEFDQVYGGMNVVQFQIDTGLKNGINSLPFLSYLEKVQQFADAQPKVSATYSYAQLMTVMNQIWEEENEGSLRLPDNQMTLGMFAMALQMRKFPFLDALAANEFRVANVFVRTRDMRSTEYLALLNNIVAFAEKNKPDGVTISATEGIHTLLESDRRIMDAQLKSLGITVGIVALTLMLLWRSIWLTTTVLLTNLIPVGLAVSLAGYADLPLNSVTVMVAAIVLSIAVDDSVHFITWWRDRYRETKDPTMALRSTLEIKGPPILFTSLMLTGVFAAFLLFSFPPVRHFGLLSAIAFVGALLSTLVLLPALLNASAKSEPARS